jgi:putative oxidoreductase
MKSLCLNLGLLVLRASLGGMMLVHGWPKLQGFMKNEPGFPDLFGLGSRLGHGLAVFAEVGCAGLLIAGLLTRLASIPLIVTMAVAHFVVHKADPWQTKELAALYLAGYITVLLTGPGAISLDGLFFRKKPEPPVK